MPDANSNDLSRHYAGLTDGELQAIAADSRDLTDEAKAALGDEIRNRGITTPAAANQSLEPSVDLQDWVIVGRFRDLPEALLAKGAVESAGIECHLTDDNMVRLDWFISNLIGGAKLVVKPEDEASAREILAQPIPETIEVEGEEEYQQPRCPKCGSLDVTYKETDPLAYLTAYMNIPAPFYRRAWRCRDCSTEWETGQETAENTPVENS